MATTQSDRFVVYLTNRDERPKTSFSDGRYGFTVRAMDMDGALTATVQRARAEGIYGYDWSALVVHERNTKWATDSQQVELCDSIDPATTWFEPMALPGGGVVLR